MTETPLTDQLQSEIGNSREAYPVIWAFVRSFERQVIATQKELETAKRAYEIVKKDCWNLTEKVIPNIKAAHEQALALRGEPVMWGISTNGKVYNAEYHKAFAEKRIADWTAMNSKFYPSRYELVPLYAAPISGERVREVHEKGCASLHWNPVRRERPSCNCALPLTAIKGEQE